MTPPLPQGFLDIFSAAALPSTLPVEDHVGVRGIQASARQGFLVFGQYQTGYPVVPLHAVFEIAIEENVRNDAACLILDVYDHSIDRVIAKTVVTRKDFRIPEELCLFVLTFTPPSPQAQLEFRVFYLGGATIWIDKIAVTNPGDIVVMTPDQTPITLLPDLMEVEDEAEEPGVPTPLFRTSCWGLTSGEVTFGRDGFRFLFVQQGFSAFGDSVVLYHLPCPDRGKMVAKLLKPQENLGLMVRNAAQPGENYLYLDAFRYRYQTDGETRSFPLLPPDAGQSYLKIVRKGDVFIGQVSDNGNHWTTVFSLNADMESKKDQVWGMCAAVNGGFSRFTVVDFTTDIDTTWANGQVTTTGRGIG